MVFVALALLLLAGVLIVAAVFTADGAVSVLGIDTNALVMFVLGIWAAAFIVMGLKLLGVGAKREWRQRKDQKRIDELAQRLDEAESRREGKNDA